MIVEMTIPQTRCRTPHPQLDDCNYQHELPGGYSNHLEKYPPKHQTGKTVHKQQNETKHKHEEAHRMKHSQGSPS